MLLLINFNNYLFSRKVVQSSVDKTQVCYVLDTDDLIVKRIPYEKLERLMKNGEVSIKNAVVSDRLDVLKFSTDMFGLLNVGESIDSLGGKVKYVIDNTETSRGMKFNTGYLSFNDIRVWVDFKIYGDTLYLDINASTIFSCHVQFADVSLSGISYYFKLGDYIVVQAMILRDYVAHCVTLVFNLYGGLIDVFSLDKEFFGNIDFKSRDYEFRAKYLTMLGGKY